MVRNPIVLSSNKSLSLFLWGSQPCTTACCVNSMLIGLGVLLVSTNAGVRGCRGCRPWGKRGRTPWMSAPVWDELKRTKGILMSQSAGLSSTVFLNICPIVRFSRSIAPLAWGWSGLILLLSIPNSAASASMVALSNSRPLSVRIYSGTGIPCWQKTYVTTALATVFACLFGMGIIAALVNRSRTTSR